MPWTKIPVYKSEYKGLSPDGGGGRRITYQDALREAIGQAMERDERVIVMGEGVDDPGGVFGTTKGLQKEFGAARVFDTPIAENGITGVAIGAALTGSRPVMVHMRMDFLLMSMDQIVNHASKWRYMSGGSLHVPLVIRSIIGRGWGSAAQHSQSLQGLFLHVPGLKVVMPATPYDAKGLLMASIADEDPVIFIEHRWLYNLCGHVPEEPYQAPLGEAAVRREGKDATIVGISYMVIEAMRAAEILEKDGLDVEVIDVRSLKPLDENLIIQSIEKTGRLVVADTGWRIGGAGSEIAALAAGRAFGSLKAPIQRVATKDSPTPSSSVLEEAFYPDAEDIASAVRETVNYK